MQTLQEVVPTSAPHLMDWATLPEESTPFDECFPEQNMNEVASVASEVRPLMGDLQSVTVFDEPPVSALMANHATLMPDIVHPTTSDRLESPTAMFIAEMEIPDSFVDLSVDPILDSDNASDVAMDIPHCDSYL